MFKNPPKKKHFIPVSLRFKKENVEMKDRITPMLFCKQSFVYTSVTVHLQQSLNLSYWPQLQHIHLYRNKSKNCQSAPKWSKWQVLKFLFVILKMHTIPTLFHSSVYTVALHPGQSLFLYPSFRINETVSKVLCGHVDRSGGIPADRLRESRMHGVPGKERL